jgi:hypothetical protein
MPTKRTRRGRHLRVELAPAVWRYLCDLAEPGDERDDAVIGFRFFNDPLSEAEAWARFGAAATAAHARVRPGRRPALWWCYDAPGDLPADESEAAFLRRHGLLLPGEPSD